MRFIPTRVHAPLDYIVGAALLAAPWIFQFSDQTAATVVPIVLGIGLIIDEAHLPTAGLLCVAGIAALIAGGLLFGLAVTVFVCSAIILLIRRGELPVIGATLARSAR